MKTDELVEASRAGADAQSRVRAADAEIQRLNESLLEQPKEVDESPSSELVKLRELPLNQRLQGKLETR